MISEKERCPRRSFSLKDVLWQIKARSESSSVLQMIPYDTEYIANSPLSTDLKILALTVPAVLTGKGTK
jgi:lipopolysaccharide/colanic/teichoic acid biosynthesis glycosyltransferase